MLISPKGISPPRFSLESPPPPVLRLHQVALQRLTNADDKSERHLRRTGASSRAVGESETKSLQGATRRGTGADLGRHAAERFVRFRSLGSLQLAFGQTSCSYVEATHQTWTYTNKSRKGPFASGAPPSVAEPCHQPQDGVFYPGMDRAWTGCSCS